MEFSVVIPLHNRQEFIRSALESVYSQSLPPREIIVVDDGSTDEGPRLVQEEFPGVDLFRQANAGPGPARNAGVERSTSPWIAFLDSDDVWRPNHLHELSRVIRASPHIGLACTAYDVSNQSIEEDTSVLVSEGRIGLIDYFLEDAPAFTSATAIFRDAFNQLGGFLSRIPGEDKELWARIACHYPVGMSTASTAIYRTGTGGISETWARKHEAPPLTIEDFSIALAVVSEALSNETSTFASDDSLRAFLNYRLEHKLRSKLIEGDIVYARALRPFFASPVELRQRALIAAIRAPVLLVRVGHRVAREVRRLGRGY